MIAQMGGFVGFLIIDSMSLFLLMTVIVFSIAPEST